MDTSKIAKLDSVQVFIDKQCVIRRDFEHRMPAKQAGKYYTWVFYLRNALYDPQCLKYICELLADKIIAQVGHTNFQLCGMESAAVPLLTGLSMEFYSRGIFIPAFSRRKEQKKYALLNWHEGIIYPDREVVLIDDLCNSSSSLKQCYDFCLGQKLKINSAFVIINKVNPGIHDKQRETSDMYLPSEIIVGSLFTLSDFGISNPSH